MLCLTLLPGEYLIIGSDVVVQLDRMSGDHCKLAIHAPREVPILRGEVPERDGGERPGCVSAMRLLLEQMDGADENVRALRRQLNCMFPAAGREAPTDQVSPG